MYSESTKMVDSEDLELFGRTAALPRWLRFRKRFAREQLVSRRGVVHERSHNGRGLHQVARLNTIVHIHVGMMRASGVLHRVLNELEARESHGIEGLMIGPAGVANSDGGRAQILERLEPRLENRTRHIVALEIDPA